MNEKNGDMKTERQIAEEIFQLFRNVNCKDNEGFFMNALNAQVVFKLNPKERELFDTVFVGLQALQYIKVDDDGSFIRLTKKGFNYIYDDALVEKMQVVPWIIPGYKNTNWIAAWNKLWKTIGDVPTELQYYYSGPRFLNTICEVDNSIESDYYKYIEYRNKKELSTSRKNYFRDLIDGLEVEKRYELYVLIQLSFEDSVFTSTVTKKDEIEQPTLNPVFEEPVKELKKSEFETIPTDNHPKVFISYSWDNEEHKKWVLELATKLCENGIDVILDQWEVSNKGGSLLADFMINSVTSSERVLCIMTPNYKKKTDKLDGGVGFEYSILSSELADDLKTTKFIPILREGDERSSTPILLNKRVSYFMRDEDDFECVFESLLRDLYNEPKTVKPAIGKKPRFD